MTTSIIADAPARRKPRPRNLTPEEMLAWMLEQTQTTDTGCWEWQRWTDKDGYGRGHWQGKSRIAHRLVFALSNGVEYDALPADRFVCHQCDNPPCINPAHLQLGTHKQSMDGTIGASLSAVRSAHHRRRVLLGTNPFLGNELQLQRLADGTHNSAKLTATQIPIIRQRLASGETGKSLAQEYGVSRVIISQIKHRKRWAHIP